MADASANVRKILSRPRAGTNCYPIANGVTLYYGQLAQLQGGYLNHWDETGTFVGIVTGDSEGISPGGAWTGDTSAAVPPMARVDQSGVTLRGLDVAGTPTQAKVGNLVFSADSNITSLTMTDTTNPPVGWLSRFIGTDDVEVTFFTPHEFMAGIADATWNS